jgi:hypothetical protein
MSIFTGKGKDVKKVIEENKKRKAEQESGEKLDYKKIKINKDLKKAGDSIRVRVLGAFDYTTYESHGSFDKGLWNTPCINPTGDGDKRCLHCEASKHEGFKDLKATTRFLFAFYDIDMEMVRYIDVSYTQGTSLMDDIEENDESLEDFAFTLKRSGEGTKTTYKLSAILSLKKDKEAKERFDKAEGETVPEDFFEKALYIKSTNQMAIDLENIKFDVEGLLGYEIQDDSNENNNNGSDNEEPKKQDGEEPDPEKVF